MEKSLKLKAKLLKTAVNLFEKQGYSNTTTRMIAEEAGVGRGHLSYYFPKKEDIARELMVVFFKKVETFSSDKVQTDCEDPYVYFAFLLKCFEYLIDVSDYFKMMVIDGKKMQTVFDSSCENYMLFLEKKLKAQSIDYDRKTLLRSIEFAILIFDHLIISELKSGIASEEEAFYYATRHFLLELNENEEKVNEVIESARNNFNKLDLNEFYSYIHEYNYEELYLSE